MPAPSYTELRDQVERLKKEVRRQQAQQADLRQQNGKLQQTVERLLEANAKLLAELEKAQRQSKRQAAPFAKGAPKPNPRRPGRKRGEAYGAHVRRLPPPADKMPEVFEAPLPLACPQCGGGVEETRVAQQFQVEIPRTPLYRQFNVHIGCCQRCGQRLQGRHALQTSDALGAAASQLGPDTQAAMGVLNKQAGLSHGKIETVLEDLFGIGVARSTSVRVVTRLGRRLEPVYQTIGRRVRRSKLAVPDETGWRVGGHKAWLHVIANHDVSYYGVEPDRSGAFAERVLGRDWTGTLIHDGWSPYDNFREAVHQQCLAHAMRRAAEIRAAALGAAARFPRRVLDLFAEALDLRDGYRAGQVSRQRLVGAADRFRDRLVGLTRPRKTYLPNEKLAAHLYRHAAEWFVFLVDPTIEATNWLAEQAIRPAVVNRKVWGGNRTWRGARAQGVVTSVIQTCRKQRRVVVDFLSHTLCGLSPILFASSTPATR